MNENRGSTYKIFMAIARPKAFVRGCTFKMLKKHKVLKPGVDLTVYPLEKEGIFGGRRKKVNVITGIRVLKPNPNETFCPFMNLFREIITENFRSTEELHDEDVIFGSLDVTNWDFQFRRYVDWPGHVQMNLIEEHNEIILMNRNELDDLTSEREHSIPLVFGDDDVKRVSAHRDDFHERIEAAREKLWRDWKFWKKTVYMFQSNMELNAYDPDLKYTVC